MTRGGERATGDGSSEGVCYGACDDFQISSVEALRTAIANVMDPVDGATAGNTLRLTQSLVLDQCVHNAPPSPLSCRRSELRC